MSSSPAAFSTTLEKHIATIEGRSFTDRKHSKLDDRILRRAIARTEEDYADGKQREAAEAEANRRARPLDNNETQILGELRSWAQQASHKEDSKARALLTWLAEHLKDGDD